MLDLSRIKSIIAMIKGVAKTDDVYVFGSYASGKATENSDLDIAVITDDTSIEEETSLTIRTRMIDMGYVPLDIVFLDRQKFRQRSRFAGNLYYEVATKGKKISD